jgi:hypothetical protein
MVVRHVKDLSPRIALATLRSARPASAARFVMLRLATVAARNPLGCLKAELPPDNIVRRAIVGIAATRLGKPSAALCGHVIFGDR